MDLSESSLIANLLVSTVGFGIFLYGKQQRRVPHFVVGVLMMVFPYFVPGALWMLLIAAAMVGGLWWAVRRGW